MSQPGLIQSRPPRSPAWPCRWQRPQASARPSARRHGANRLPGAVLPTCGTQQAGIFLSQSSDIGVSHPDATNNFTDVPG